MRRSPSWRRYALLAAALTRVQKIIVFRNGRISVEHRLKRREVTLPLRG
jgi:hypothetical protein